MKPTTPRATPIIIPAYNPPPLFEGYVRSLRRSIAQPILVINDGSDAAYTSVFRVLSGIASVTVLHHPKNLGKGAALKTGFGHAALEWPESGGYVTADADGQHHVGDIQACIREAIRAPQALIIGARARPHDMPKQNHFGRRTASAFLSVLYGVRIQDTQSGLRYVPKALAARMVSSPFDRYDFEMDMIFRAISLKAPIREFPIRTIYLEGNRHSKYRVVRDTMRVTSVYFYHLRHIFRRRVTS